MRRGLISLLLCLVLCLSGCTEDVVQVSSQPDTPPPAAVTPTPQQTEFVLPYYPDVSLHPILGNHRSSMVLNSLVYQGLFELDNSFSPHAVLCSEASVSENGLTWSFVLGDALFSDGYPITAADVVFSLDLARSSTLYAQRLSQVQTIRADGVNTVVMTLSKPNGALPALLDIPIIGDRGDGSMPLGTGPYAYAEDEGPLRLVRQACAPDTAPEEIPLYPVEAADQLIYAFDSGSISLVISDLTGSNSLGYSSGHEVFSYPTASMMYVGFQTQTGPCQNSAVRQAISRSFDRDTVTASLLSGYGEATCLPFSPRSELHSSEHEQNGAYSSSAAAELLSQAGYTSGEDGLLRKGRQELALTFVVNTDNTFKLTIAEYLAGQLTDLGISVDLKKLAWADYLTALEKGDFDLYLGETTLTADFDLSPLLQQDGTLNYGGYTSPEADGLLAQLSAATQELRPQAAATLLDQFQLDAPLAPLCFKSHCVLTQWQAVSGLVPTRQNPFYHLESLRFGAET